MSSFIDLMDLEDSEDSQKEFKPIWTINLNDDDEVLSWLLAEFTHLLKLNKSRHDEMIENLMLYKGDKFSSDDKTTNDFLDISRKSGKSKKRKLVINHLFDVTETIVSRTIRNSPQPEVMPANSNELSDRNAANASQRILNYLSFINRLVAKNIKLKRQSILFGEAYTTNLWNPDLGDIHPAWIEAKAKNFIDTDGKVIKDIKGNPLSEKNILKTGEVEIQIIVPWRILLQEKDCYDDVNYCFLIELVDVDELKIDYPKMKDKIKPLELNIFDAGLLKSRKLRNETLRITFWYRKTKYMSKGAEIIFTPEVLLESNDIPYQHNELPISRLTDMDIEGMLHAESFYSQVKNIQWSYNELTSDIIANQRMMGKPKWMVPKGRADIKALGDARTVVQFSGSVPPVLVSANPTPPEIFGFRRELKEELEQISTVTGVARRNPPKGMIASVAMRFMSELEAERVSVSVSKHNEFIRHIYAQMLSIAGTYYDASDGRTMRILGKDQEFELQSFDVANLSKAYDVIIRNIPALAESKSVKDARIFDVLDRRPELLTDEQLIDVLEIGAVDKMTSIITDALRSAESENEALLSGRDVPEPAVYEDLIPHWRTHFQRFQSYSLKIAASPDEIEGLEEHLWMTEFLMVAKAKENPTFEAELAKLIMFPIFYRDGQAFKPSSKAHQEAIVQGQANRGDDITGNIPATNIEIEQPLNKQQVVNKNEKL